MTDRTAVANAALVKLGREEIVTSLDEDTEPARKARAVFSRVAKAELRKHPWSFAKGRASLAALADAPAFGWQRAFQLPADWLRCVQVGDYYDFAEVREILGQPLVPYEIEGRTILTDLAAPLHLRYIRDLSEDTANWDATFVEAMACRLAMELCETLTGSASKAELMGKAYKDAIRDARRVNAIELPPQPMADNSWMTTRIV